MTDEPLKPEDIKPGMKLEMYALGRVLPITVREVLEDQFVADFGPVPFSNLHMLRRVKT